MKVLYAVLFVTPVLCLLGCNESPPGGPNAAKPNANKTVAEKTRDATGVGTAEDTFKISVPTLETGIKQGERKTVKIGISRGKNFEQDVKLDFGKLPAGVSATPATPMLTTNTKEVEVTLEASKDAAIGEYTIPVTATPAQGAPTSAEMKIEVKKS